MLMLKILENDLHRSRNSSAVPLIVEVPARPEFLPSLVSNSVGNFLVSRKLTQESRIRVGVFAHNPDKIDDLIPRMLQSALNLSKDEGWGNVFTDAKSAFKHVKSESNMPVQPHVCVVPSSWEKDRVMQVLHMKSDATKYQKYCHVVQHDIPFIAFLSKPEQVGLYTHFLGGHAALLLHNVRRGIAFCT